MMNNDRITPRRPNRFAAKIQPKTSIPPIFRRLNEHLLEDEIPERIEGVYSDDYDILKVHHIILAKLKKEKKDIHLLTRRREALLIKLEQRLKVVERTKLIHELHKLNLTIESIDSDERKNNYLLASQQLIKNYQQLGPMIRHVSFVSDEETNDFSEVVPQQSERLSIIRKYLLIAKQYININVIRIISNIQHCPNCGHDLILVDPEDYSLERCEECGYEKINLSKSIPTTGAGVVSMKDMLNFGSEDRENFIHALECYLGEQQTPPGELFEALDKWSTSYHHPSKDRILEMPLNKNGTRGEYGREMLLQALGDIGYADNYKDLRLIGHLYWGWELPTLSHQERELIIQDYDNTQVILRNIMRGRKSSINTQIRLYRHLEARGHDVNPADFKLPATPSIIEEADSYWRVMITAIPGAIFTSLK